MCGIVGLAGEIHVPQEKVFENLLIMDILRGKHSTGVASVGRNTKDVIVAKKAVAATDFIDMPCFKDALSGVNSVLIGHNRYATVGKVNNMNAHPFDFENVVGVHNGTLTSRYKLFEQNKFDTDSEAFYSHVNKFGIEDAIASCTGAYAFVWYDKREETINFLRNGDRTLYLAKLADKPTIAWASESWMLHGALSRNNMKYESIDLIPADSWFAFPVKDGKIGKPRLKEVKETPVKKSNGGYDYFHNNNYRGNIPNSSAATARAEKHPLAGRKGQILQIKSLVNHIKGLSYFMCHCPETKDDNIKFYPNKEHLSQISVGDWIEADINNYATPEGIATVDVRSVRKIDMEQKEKSKDTKRNILTLPKRSADKDPVFKNHKGVYVLRAAWLKQYGECSYCTTNIDPEKDEFTMTSDGECFCESCSKSEDVKPFIKTA